MSGWRTPGSPYTPSNGTDGEIFMERFCFHCKHDEFFRDEGGESCEIILRSLCEEPTPEWIIDEDGLPTCTKFLDEEDEEIEINPDQMSML